MADSTVNYGFPYPEGGDRVAVHTDVEKLAKSVDAAALQTNLLVDSAIPFRGPLDEQTGTLATLAEGRYLVRYVATAEAWGLPQQLLGQLEVVDAGSQRRIRFTPNDAGAGWGDKYAWELATNSVGVLRDRWQRVDKTIMRTSPVVLTGPAGEYPQANSRGSVRLPFTVPTGVSKVRVHMRPWNFRTRKEWGPARLSGVMIAQQSSGGGITGSRWYAPNVDGQIVTGSEEWVSDWFYVGLVPGNTYLLSYGAEWQDDVRDLVMGTCWSSFELDDWDTDGPVNYQTGWGQFGLQPMDIWIECEAPSSVPVWGYYGSSNTVGVSSGDAVFGAYANVHARKNGAFAAITAAGGWSLMDETMHDSAIINRLGYPARMLDRVYLDLGANIEARDATAAEAIAEMERWMNTRLNTLGNPPVYLLTQISRYTSEETKDTAGTLSDWNEWIRYEATQRPEVVGLIDQAAIFADPEKPWTARVELRASPTDVHFSAMGQKLRAAALDGEVHLPMLTAKNAQDMPRNGGAPWRDITAMLDSSRVTGGRVYIRRSEGFVEYSIAGLHTSGNGVILAWGTLPLEYRPTTAALFLVYGENGSTADLTPSSGGGLSLTRGWAGVPYWGTGRLATAQPWPTEHPGVEAGWGEQPDLALSPADAARMIGRVYTNVDGLQAIVDRIAYDSGWRDVTSLLDPDYLALNPNATVYISRIGNEVTMNFSQGAGATASGLHPEVLLLPSGFRTTGQARPWGSPGLDVQTGKQVIDGAGLYLDTSGWRVNLNATPGKRYSFTMRWTTHEDPPASPPGTPV